MHAMSTRGHRWDVGLKIEHFFQVYKDLEGHVVSTGGFADRASAIRVIQDARRRLRG
jgi:inorganic pyrophosphatase